MCLLKGVLDNLKWMKCILISYVYDAGQERFCRHPEENF